MDINQGLPILLGIAFLGFGASNNHPGLIGTVVLALYLRWTSFRNIFLRSTSSLWDVANSFISHTLLFSSLYVLLETEYTVSEPSGTLVDSIYYSIDTVTTNGAARVFPNSERAKIIHIINLLDSYLMLITLGFYIVRNVKGYPIPTSLQYENRETE